MKHTANDAGVRVTLMEKLLLWRRRHKYTREQAAKVLGVKARTLRSWETGQRRPKPIVMRVLKDIVSRES